MERYEVILTSAAKADVRAAARYIAVELRQPDTAEELLDCVDREITSLEQLLERYELVRDASLACLGIWKTMVGKYLLFYTVDPSARKVTVVRFLHSRRSWMRILAE